MARQQNVPSRDGSSPGSSADGSNAPSAGPVRSSFRRAVALGSVGADPGPTLSPAVPESTGAKRGESEATARLRPDTSAEGAASARPSVTSGAAAEGAAASEQRLSEPAAASASEGTQAASAAAAATPEARAAAMGAGAATDGAGRSDGEPPSGNPKKSLLAAAGIAGVVLLAVPLLIFATDDSKPKKDKVSVAAKSDTVLQDDVEYAPRGNYAPAKPTPKPSSAKPTPKAQKPAPPISVPAPPFKASVKSAPPVKPKPKPKPKTQAPVVEPAPPKPAPNTAALAVSKLAASSGGRHICYRAYMADTGWQAPVCDGATAGVEGQNRAIKALNIAVSDTNGTAASPFIQGAGWTVPWKGVGNGGDLVIGDPRQSAPNMGGFAINVDNGASGVCQNAHVSESGWLGLGCDTRESPNNYIFGGDVSTERALEAVRFTV
ncbi:hypothetical protein M2271_006106 [Streptomyces sp. LBL]|uniref:hypothetical protein n=1 Tax=Streptomyces sp. LBL TaxID=2940562 RepID=UPI0024756BEC|nr:hypothetical protein [Streptomyces sp. LBL]MDH6628274.1 hypothetical protein [Streptomyces sp. LBL]